MRVLEAVTADPDRPIGDVDMLTAAERERPARRWTRRAPARAAGTAADLFGRAAAAVRDADRGPVATGRH